MTQVSRLAGLFVLFAAFQAVSSRAAVFTPGEFKVSDSGAAVYTIPIRVPPGTAGLEPKLSLVYGSQMGNGPLGMGGSLSGFSAITRCPQTVAQDGARGGINFDANDRFCMDGQRLMAVTGSYGADGTEYRTEREGFAKIVSYGAAGTGPAWFKVYTKAGLTMELGNTADSRIEAQGKTTVRVWALNKVQDTKGNYFTVSYTEDNPNGQYYPARIDYTGNSAAGLAPYNSVQFLYAARPDSTPLYQAGSLIKSTVRPTNVQAFAGAALVTDYRLTYEQGSATQRSRLTSVTECAGDGACLQPTTFGWQDSSTGFQQAGTTATAYTDAAGYTNGLHLFAMDVDGSGHTDLVARNGADGSLTTRFTTGGSYYGATATATSYTDAAGYNGNNRFFTLDMDGDGRGDLVVRNGADGSLYTWLSSGGTFTLTGTTVTAYTDSSGYSGLDRFFPMDVNGDGRTDLVVRGLSLVNSMFKNTVVTWLSNGSTLIEGSTSILDTAVIYPFTGQIFFPMDANGDGRADLLGRNSNDGGSLQLWLSTGTGFVLGWSQATGYSDSAGYNGGQNFFPVDVNGDGLTDLVARNGNNGDLHTWLSTGTGFAYLGATATGYTDSAGYNGQQNFFPMDVNGDGKADLVVRNGSTGALNIWISTGTGFTYSGVTTTGYTNAAGYNGGQNFFPVDANGDGKADFAVRNGTDGTIYTRISSGVFPDLLTTVTNGLGAAVTVTYKPLSGTTGGAGTPVYPVRRFQAPVFQVVQSYSVSDGIGGNYATNYNFAGSSLDLQGRGFLGFQSQTVTDPQTGLQSTITYRQDYPYTGLPSRVDRSSGATLLGRVDNTYASTALGGSRYFVYLSQGDETSHELDGAFVTKFRTVNQFDAYGNPTQITVSSLKADDTAEGYSKSTANTYTNDAVNWILGRLTRAAVTSTIPGPVSQTRASAFEYDPASGLLTREIIEPDIPGLRLTTDYVYDAYGNKTSMTVSGQDVVSRTSTTTFDAQGRFAIGSANALGHSESRAFDSRFGSATSLTGPNGLTTTWSYDGFGRKMSETRADGTSSAWTYTLCVTGCPANAVYFITASATASPTGKAYFDKLNREIRAETQGFDGAAIYKDTQYDSFGRVLRASRPYYAGGSPAWSTFDYDVLGRVVIETYPDNTATTRSYSGLTTTTTNSLDQRETRIKNSQGQLVQVLRGQ